MNTIRKTRVVVILILVVLGLLSLNVAPALACHASIGDFVWKDLDRDGIQDEGEPGLAGVTVKLYNCLDGSLFRSTHTAGNGYYWFDSLPWNQSYYVKFEAPDGYAFSPQNQDDGYPQPDERDSDANAAGMTECTFLAGWEEDRTWDAGLYQPVCDLTVVKTCQAPPPPTQFLCSDAKPLNELTMIWNGTQAIRIKAWKGDAGSSLLADIDNIAPQEVVTVGGYAGASNDVIWEIFAAGTDNPIGKSTFHLSCSDQQMNGPEDCGLPQGDGKDKMGFLNNWLLEGMAGQNGMALVCNPQPLPPSPSCELVPAPAPGCEALGKPSELTFKYTGGTCDASANNQGDKAKCTDSTPPDLTQPVRIVYTGKDPHKFTVSPSDESIGTGDRVTLEATGRNEFHADTKLEIWQGTTLVQFLQIHTSCSQPLEIGDVFGSLELVAFNGQETPTNEVTYFYEATNNGSALSNVTLTDIPLGHIAGPFNLDAGGTQTFQTVAQIFETTTNEGIFSGLLADGSVCSGSAFATVTVVEPCAECKGGVTELTLRYLGTSAASVAVYNDKEPKPDKILYESGVLEPGDEFTFTKPAPDDKFSKNISVWIDDALNTIIHTSCSQPIGPGLIKGDFEVVEGYSKDNGRICPLKVCAPHAAAQIEFHDREIKWNITNNGDVGLEIAGIEINWPADNGYLDEIKRDKDVIHKGNFDPPSAVVASGWEGDANKRTIKPGETDTLKLKFQNNASTQGAYSIRVDFVQGCFVEIH